MVDINAMRTVWLWQANINLYGPRVVYRPMYIVIYIYILYVVYA